MVKEGSTDHRIQRAPSVLFVLPDLETNGAIKQTLVIAEGVAKASDIRSAVYVLNMPNEDRPKLSVPLFGVTTDFDILPFLGRSRIVTKINHKMRRMMEFVLLLLAMRKFDVVFAAFEAGGGLTQPARAARILRKRFCIIVHNNILISLPGYFPDWPVETTKRHFRRANRLILVSQGLEVALTEFLGEDEAMPPLIAIQNGIDVETHLNQLQAPAVCESDIAPDSLGRFFLAVGRLDYQKGLDWLIHAHALALGAGEKHVLVLAGDGPDAYKEQLQAQARDLGVADSVHFVGYCSNPAGLLQHAYGYCMTSRFEGFSLALAEAAAAGAPCIAMHCISGPNEILSGGKYGDLVPNGDVAAMANAMVAHLRNPAPLRQKAAASRADASRLDRGTMIQKYVRIIEEL